MASTYYKAVKGITHGMVHYEPGVVFKGDEVLDGVFAENGGKQGDEVLYEKSDASAFDEYNASQERALVDGSPRGVVGFEPTGEDALTDAQVTERDEDGKPSLVEADAQAAKPEDGDPLVPDSAEAARRLGLDVDQAAGDLGGEGPAAEVAEAPKSRRSAGSSAASGDTTA